MFQHLTRTKRHAKHAAYLFVFAFVFGIGMTILAEVFGDPRMSNGYYSVQGFTMPPVFYFCISLMSLVFFASAIKTIMALFNFGVEAGIITKRGAPKPPVAPTQRELEAHRAREAAPVYDGGDVYDPSVLIR